MLDQTVDICVFSVLKNHRGQVVVRNIELSCCLPGTTGLIPAEGRERGFDVGECFCSLRTNFSLCIVMNAQTRKLTTIKRHPTAVMVAVYD